MKKYVTLFLIFLSFYTFASVDVYEFETPEQEAQFRHLIDVLRCPTCQNQNLSGSNSLVSEDLKQIVYEKVKAGESDQEIVQFMKKRYGEFILFEPEVSKDNLILWTAPFLFLFIALTSFFIWYRKNKGELNE